MIDVVSFALNLTIIICDDQNVALDKITAIASIAVCVMWIKLFYYCRIFSTFQTFVRLIRDSVIDMIPFLFVFFIAIFAFGNTYYILGYDSLINGNTFFAGGAINGGSSTFPYGIIYSYQQGIGQFDTTQFPGQPDEVFITLLYYLNTLISLVILLNLVVALLGDTFDRVNESASKIELQEKARMICENEFILNRWLLFRHAKYLIVIDQEQAEGQSGGWDGKLNQLKTFMEEAAAKHIEQLKKMDDNLETTLNDNADKKNKILESKIQQKLVALESRLDEVISDLYLV